MSRQSSVAAVVPFHRARCALAISGGETRSWEVGRLVAKSESERSPSMSPRWPTLGRVIDPNDLAAIASDVVGTIGSAKILYLEGTESIGGSLIAQRAHAVARSIAEAAAAVDVAIVVIPYTWRGASVSDPESLARDLLAFAAGGASVAPKDGAAGLPYGYGKVPS